MNQYTQKMYDRLTLVYPYPVEVEDRDDKLIIKSSFYLMENLVEEFGASRIWFSTTLNGLVID